MDRSPYPHISMCQCGSVSIRENPVQIILIWIRWCCSSGKSFARMRNSTLQSAAQTICRTTNYKMISWKLQGTTGWQLYLPRRKIEKFNKRKRNLMFCERWMGIDDYWCNRKLAWKGGFHYCKTCCSSDKHKRLVLCYWWPRLSLWRNQSALQFFQITSWKCRTQRDFRNIVGHFFPTSLIFVVAKFLNATFSADPTPVARATSTCCSLHLLFCWLCVLLWSCLLHVFFTFLKLYKWYQITQHIADIFGTLYLS